MTDLSTEDLIQAARVSKAWPFQEAQKLLKRYPDGKPNGEPVLFETGYGPSGSAAYRHVSGSASHHSGKTRLRRR